MVGSGTLSGCIRFCARVPGVSLRSTPGYCLASLRDGEARHRPEFPYHSRGRMADNYFTFQASMPTEYSGWNFISRRTPVVVTGLKVMVS
jgi:hypothetical protein